MLKEDHLMKRAAQERQFAFNRRKKHYLQFWRWNRQEREELAVNRFRKMLRIGGCCKARCYLCHGEKLLGFKTLWEQRAEDLQRDGEQELPVKTNVRRSPPSLPRNAHVVNTWPAFHFGPPEFNLVPNPEMEFRNELPTQVFEGEDKVPGG
jgi:hypothetical protein